MVIYPKYLIWSFFKNQHQLLVTPVGIAWSYTPTHIWSFNQDWHQLMLHWPVRTTSATLGKGQYGQRRERRWNWQLLYLRLLRTQVKMASKTTSWKKWHFWGDWSFPKRPVPFFWASFKNDRSFCDHNVLWLNLGWVEEATDDFLSTLG